MTSTPNRGEVWAVDFDPPTGHEINKVRPAVVVSVPEVGRLPLRIVVPLTNWQDRYEGFIWFVLIPADARNGLAKDSGVDAFQVKSLSLARFRQKIGTLTLAQMDEHHRGDCAVRGVSVPVTMREGTASPADARSRVLPGWQTVSAVGELSGSGGTLGREMCAEAALANHRCVSR